MVLHTQPTPDCLVPGLWSRESRSDERLAALLPEATEAAHARTTGEV
jgi:hypothetical protein